MKRRRCINLSVSAIAIMSALLLPGCVMTQTTTRDGQRVERSVTEFERIGAQWGKDLKKQHITPQGELNKDFVKYLNENLDYFSAHAELKDAFKRGFRFGYEDRIADLVLGPHIKQAAGDVGEITSNKITKIIEDFDRGWQGTLSRAIDVFIVLISEGSQADRDIFIKKFENKYAAKYDDMNKPAGNKSVQVTEGGTWYVFPKELGALTMPKPETMRTKIYSQAFSVMGDEWGRRYSTNLVRRDELVEMLRRCKPALDEGEGQNTNLRYICSAFITSYGADGDDMFRGIMKDAGFKEKQIEQIVSRK